MFVLVKYASTNQSYITYGRFVKKNLSLVQSFHVPAQVVIKGKIFFLIKIVKVG